MLRLVLLVVPPAASDGVVLGRAGEGVSEPFCCSKGEQIYLTIM